MVGEMMTMAVKSIDASSLNRAVSMALEVTQQEPRNLVINTGRGIAIRAKELTPFVAQATIDTELGVISTPILSTRGKRKGLPLKSGKKTIEIPDQSMAIRIVLARLWPGSDFNQRTNQRWAIDRAQFSPGGGVAGFWAAVQAAAKRMVSARHSSTNFLQAGWSSVYRKLTQLRYGAPPLVPPDEFIGPMPLRGAFEELGGITLSGSGASASLLMENLVGMRGVNAESYNEALHKHGTGPLQQAIEDKAQEMQSRYLPRWQAKLAAKWNSIP